MTALHSPRIDQRDSDLTGADTTTAEFPTPDLPALLERACAGDGDAYGEVYRAHSQRLLRHAFRLCGNAVLAEELAADTLVEAWTQLRRFNRRCEFFTWLCAILLNRYRNHSRKNRRLVFAAGTPDADPFQVLGLNPADPANAPDEVAATRDQSILVRNCIARLPARHQQVIYLRFYVDDSLEGIAAALGCSVGTVKSRLFYALDKLRKLEALHPPGLAPTNQQ